MNAIRNKVQLIGNMGKEVELVKSENGRVRARLCLATNEVYQNAKGEKVTETQWHNNIIAFGKMAENMERLLKKGSKVAITGKLIHRNYEDKAGATRYITEIIANDFEFFGTPAAAAASEQKGF